MSEQTETSSSTTTEAAPMVRRIAAQTGFEARIILANGEQLMLAFILPLLALIAVVHLPWVPLPTPAGHHRVDVAVPGVLGVAVVSTAFTGQAIVTAFDRRNGVLRLLGTTPLGRGGLLFSRFLAVLAVVFTQSVVLGGVGLFLGWQPNVTAIVAATIFAVLGCLTFLALGMLLGGTVRAEGVLAIANLAWVLLSAVGGLMLPTSTSGFFAPLVRALPSSALGEGLRTALIHGQIAVFDLAILLIWAVLAVLAARRWFRWS